MAAENGNAEELRDWTSLPEELLSLVLSNLNLKDVKRFHAVCKTWRSVADPKDHNLCEFPGVGSQWLIEKRSNSCTFRLFHPLSRDTFCLDAPAGLNGSSIRFSKDGWLLMTRGETEIFFFNPFSTSRIDLPHLPKPHLYGSRRIPPLMSAWCLESCRLEMNARVS